MADRGVVQHDHRRLGQAQRELVELLGSEVARDRFGRGLHQAVVIAREQSKAVKATSFGGRHGHFLIGEQPSIGDTQLHTDATLVAVKKV